MATHDLLGVRARSAPTHTLLGVRASGPLLSGKTHTLLRVRASGAVETAVRHTLLGVRAQGSLAMIAEPIATRQNIEPGRRITVTPSFTGATPTSATWVQIDGPTVRLQTSGLDVSFIAPATGDASVVTLGLVGARGAQLTEQVTARFQILPGVVRVNGRSVAIVTT